MIRYKDSPLHILNNGSISIFDISIGNTEKEATDKLYAQELSFKKENNCIIIDPISFTSNFPQSIIRIYIDYNNMVVAFYITCRETTKEYVDNEYHFFNGFFRLRGFKQQKETFTNDIDNESKYTNGLCSFEIDRVISTRPFETKERYSIRIIVQSGISAYHIPDNVKKAHMRLLANLDDNLIGKKNSEKHTHRNIVKISSVALLCIVIGLIGFVTWSKENKKTSLDKYVYVDNAYVIHSQNGCTAVFKKNNSQSVVPINPRYLYYEESMPKVCSVCFTDSLIERLYSIFSSVAYQDRLWLFERLKNQYSDVNDWKKFNIYLDDINKRKALYEEIKDKYNLGDFEEFNENLTNYDKKSE